MVLGLIEHTNGELDKPAQEMLNLGAGLAQDLGTRLEGIMVGKPGDSLLESLQTYGVEKVYYVDDDRLVAYAPEAWARSVIFLMDEKGPQVMLAPGSDRGNEIMAHVAAEKELSLATNCTQVAPGDPFLVTRVQWGGTVLEEVLIQGQPVLLTVAPFGILAEGINEGKEIEAEKVQPQFLASDFRVQVAALETEQEDKISLSDARIVIGGGRGVGSAEGFEVLDRLAALLGGTVGGSRVATNNGWRPHTDQIGQTGTRISPDLYIACGISGASQHMVGCMGAKKILAINTDREAPIFFKADYGVIGDLHEVLPAIISELQKEN